MHWKDRKIKTRSTRKLYEKKKKKTNYLKLYEKKKPVKMHGHVMRDQKLESLSMTEKSKGKRRQVKSREKYLQRADQVAWGKRSI